MASFGVGSSEWPPMNFHFAQLGQVWGMLNIICYNKSDFTFLWEFAMDLKVPIGYHHKFWILLTIKTIFDVEKFYVKLNLEVLNIIHNKTYFDAEKSYVKLNLEVLNIVHNKTSYFRCWKILREIEFGCFKHS